MAESNFERCGNCVGIVRMRCDALRGHASIGNTALIDHAVEGVHVGVADSAITNLTEATSDFLDRAADMVIDAGCAQDRQAIINQLRES